MESERIKHLEFIQNVITRMNTNSFQVKGWTVTIVSVLLALYASARESGFILVGIVPVLVFWFLDAYYLTQERRFRGLYDDVAGVSEKAKPVKLFSMNTAAYSERKHSYWRVLLSRTIWPMYVPLMLFLGGLLLYVKLK
jgi:hypothetical protein